MMVLPTCCVCWLRAGKAVVSEAEGGGKKNRIIVSNFLTGSTVPFIFQKKTPGVIDRTFISVLFVDFFFLNEKCVERLN